VENICNMKVRPVEQNQIAADHDVRVIRRRRRENALQIGRAGLHFFLKPRRQGSVYHQLTLQSGRKTITLGQARRETRIITLVPTADLIAVMIGIAVVAMAMAVAVSMASVIIVVAIVLLVPMPVALSHSDCRRERH
jgi:hypothetical protein